MNTYTYHVEENTGGREGIGEGPATGVYATSAEAREALAAAKARGNGATCIRRDPSGNGRLYKLGPSRTRLVPFVRRSRA